MTMGAGLIWLRIGSSDGLMNTRMNILIRQTQEYSFLAERLKVSQEGHSAWNLF
jgi:hypothetical protein